MKIVKAVRVARIAAAIMFAVVAPATPAQAEMVSTLAGSGRAGNDDGSAATASFMLPLGLAYDRAGNLLVADGAGQRIRLVRKDGRVETLAGGGEPGVEGTWVPGGYADGDARTARFNRPAGIAVLRDGTVFVADTYNNCIRRITPAGAVSTWIGSPAGAGIVAGARAVAQLGAPVGLAIDREQRLYVLTENGTLAVADAQGTVSILQRYVVPWRSSPMWALAAADAPNGPVLFIGDETGLYVRRPDGTSLYYRNARAMALCSERAWKTRRECAQPAAPTVDGKNVGAPSAVVPLNAHLVAYTDAGANLVRVLDVDTGTVRRLVGSGAEDGSANTAGSQDSNGTDAAVDRPASLALAPDGRLVLGEAGNRRLRTISGIDMHEALTSERLASFVPGRRERVVAYAGDASVWPGEPWEATIEGQIEALLRRADAPRRAEVVPLVLSPVHGDSIGAFRAVLADRQRRFDTIVLEVSADSVARFVGRAVSDLDRDRAWKPAVTTFFTHAKNVLARRGTRLYVVVRPTPEAVSPTEAMWERLLTGAETSIARARAATARVVETMHGTGVTVLDLSGAFQRIGSAGGGPLFAAHRSALAPIGRRTLAERVAAAVAGSR